MQISLLHGSECRAWLGRLALNMTKILHLIITQISHHLHSDLIKENGQWRQTNDERQIIHILHWNEFNIILLILTVQ